MNNFLTFHAEATPDGVNIMYRSNDGMTERVDTVSYIDAVNRLDAGDYDDKPDEGMFIHLAIASGGNQGYFDYTSQHHVIMWRCAGSQRGGGGLTEIIVVSGTLPRHLVN